jgi:hypothetical protein
VTPLEMLAVLGAGLDDLGESVRVRADRLDDAARRRGVGDERPVAVAHRDDPDDLEGDEGLAECRAAHAEALGELSLGGQPVAGRETVLVDPSGDLLGHLLVEPGAREAGHARCRHGVTLLTVGPLTYWLGH